MTSKVNLSPTTHVSHKILTRFFLRFRFVSEVPKDKEKEKEKPEPQPKEVEKKEVKIVRTKTMWQPSQLLCYKMNIEATAGYVLLTLWLGN